MSLIRTTCHMVTLLMGLWAAVATSHAEVTVLYSTGFEVMDGFDSAYELPYQDGWLGDPYYETNGAVNSSGIFSNAISPSGQEAFVGLFKPNPLRPFVSVWRPVNHVPTNNPLVHFEVLMAIADSSAEYPDQDNFRWSVYNIEGNRLLTVDFDNYYKDVSYLLDGSSTNELTQQQFTNDVLFWFSLDMDFEANQWSASIDGVPFLAGLPISTAGASLTLGDVDAVWAIYDPNNPGDNFMTFDNYRITALPTGTDEAWIERLGFAGSAFALRLYGPDECRYAIEVTTDLMTWMPLKTNFVTSGSFDFIDTTPLAAATRFYRARFVP